MSDPPSGWLTDWNYVPHLPRGAWPHDLPQIVTYLLPKENRPWECITAYLHTETHDTHALIQKKKKKIVILSPPHSQVLMGLRRGKNAYTQYDLSFFFSFLFRQFHFCLFFFNFLGFFLSSLSQNSALFTHTHRHSVMDVYNMPKHKEEEKKSSMHNVSSQFSLYFQIILSHMSYKKIHTF